VIHYNNHKQLNHCKFFCDVMHSRELDLFGDRKGFGIIFFGQLELLMMEVNLGLMLLELGTDHLATTTDEFLDFFGADKPAIPKHGWPRDYTA
jgi:hypothetical protein